MSKISVLMSVWEADCPLLFERALISIIDQEYPAHEIVIVCDGPVQSGIHEVIEKYYNYKNIVVLKLKKNVGLAKALNYGLAQCRNDLIARMDADDISYPMRLKYQVRFMLDNPHIVASSGIIDEIDKNGDIIAQRRLPCDELAIIRFAKYRSPLNHPLAIFRRDVVIKLGGYPVFRKAQDFALWSVLLKNGHKVSNIDIPLLAMQTGDSLLKRRSVDHLREEIRVIAFQWRIGWINVGQLCISCAIRVALRCSPFFIKRVFYKFIRK